MKEKEAKSKERVEELEEESLKVKKAKRNADYTDFPSLEDRLLEYDDYKGIDRIIADYHQTCSQGDNYYISNSDRIFYWARKIYFTTDPYERKELLDAFISAGYMFPKEYFEDGSFYRRLDYLLYHAPADIEGADKIRVMRICQHLTAPRGLSSYGPYPFVDQRRSEMQGINRVIVVGRLTRDAELAYITGANGYPTLKFSIANNWRKKKRDGGWQEEVSYFDVSLLGKIGEAIVSYATKGRRVVVDGRLRQSRWADRQGGTRSKIYIEATYVQLADGKQQSSGQQSHGQQGYQDQSQQGQPQQSQSRQQEFDDDDIPF